MIEVNLGDGLVVADFVDNGVLIQVDFVVVLDAGELRLGVLDGALGDVVDLVDTNKKK